MKTETVSRTIPVELETSNRKAEKAREAVDRWQEVARTMAEYMPSFPDHRWGSKQDSAQYSLMTDEYPDHNGLQSKEAEQALFKVGEAFASYRENGYPGNEWPIGQFGDDNYMRIFKTGITVEENDRGYGIKLRFAPYDYEWFHASVGGYGAEYLQKIVDGEYTICTSELRLDDDELTLNLTYQVEIDVYESDDVEYVAGVDLNVNTPYAVTVRDTDGSIETVEVESTGKYRHHREEISRKRDRFQKRGQLEKVKEMKSERRRYTSQVCHVISRRIVDIACEYTPCCVALEDLTGYREDTDGAVHDWPYAEIQEKIMYKAKDRSIPTTMVDPSYTSVTCRKCKTTDSSLRSGAEMYCPDCDYEVHADVNAAMNIADRGIDKIA